MAASDTAEQEKGQMGERHQGNASHRGAEKQGFINQFIIWLKRELPWVITLVKHWGGLFVLFCLLLLACCFGLVWFAFYRQNSFKHVLKRVLIESSFEGEVHSAFSSSDGY